MSFNRRSFIRCASLAAAGNVAGLRPFGAINGFAQSTPGYKALVCIFLYGGNDANNSLVPLDTAANGNNGYSAYSAIRGPLALSQGSLQVLGGGAGGNFGLHQNLLEISSLFNTGEIAIVANVGTLVQPITAADYRAGAAQTPSNLFSHPDQQMEWQNAAQSAGTPTGWAGRISDSLTPIYNPAAKIPLVTSVYGDTLFCNGSATSPVAVSPGNLQGGACSEGAACAGRLATAQLLVTFSSGVSLVQADNGITADAYKYMSTLADAAQSVSPLKTAFPANNSLAAQLKQIAQIIQIRQELGVNRQIFFAGMGNFDTHASQLSIQAALLAQLSPAMAAFYQATKDLGVANEVTSFTMSDFSRALQPNSNTGSDHAWGGHHFIMGGAVKGGQIYGQFPELALGGHNDSGLNGRWVPTTASVQYASTLASWFGVPNASLNSIFPTLAAFGAETNLGFV